MIKKNNSFPFDLLRSKILLAPMAGITDMPFRILCVEQGCGLVYTEMASAKGMFYKSEKTDRLVNIDKQEQPAAIQLFGSDPQIMAQMAEKLNDSPAILLDINMGCPAPKITRNGEGSALMRNPELAHKIISEVVKASDKPVTVKFRKGWDEESINAVDFAKNAEQAGACAVTIHGRTRNQFYSGNADWDIISKIKNAIKIPVIGNGDVTCPHTAVKMFEQTGCDALMIGRAAHGDPWLFSRINTYINTGVVPELPSKEVVRDLIFRHFDMLIELKGVRTAVNEMRPHIARYVKGMQGATRFRNEVFKLEDIDLIKEAILEYFN